MKSGAITLREISYRSGFSVSTVSKALNNKEDISVETRRAIKGIARKFNYVPNNFAVGLRGKKTTSIAIILSSVVVPHFNKVLFHLQKAAAELGYRVLLYQTLDTTEIDFGYINRLNDGSVDGFFIISDSSLEEKSLKKVGAPILKMLVTKDSSTEDINALVQNSLFNFQKLKESE